LLHWQSADQKIAVPSGIEQDMRRHSAPSIGSESAPLWKEGHFQRSARRGEHYANLAKDSRSDLEQLPLAGEQFPP